MKGRHPQGRYCLLLMLLSELDIAKEENVWNTAVMV
jgi:hypothetical protein